MGITCKKFFGNTESNFSKMHHEKEKIIQEMKKSKSDKKNSDK